MRIDDAAAQAALRDSVAARPDAVETMAAIGAALRDQGEAREAEAWFARALSIRPGDVAVVAAFGAMLQLQGRYQDALSLAEATISGNATSGEAWLLRGDALANMSLQSDAITAYAEAARDPATALRAKLGAGKAHRVLGQTEAALEAFAEASQLAPEAPEPIFERGLLRLERQDFANGWMDYAARWRCERFLNGSRGQVPAALVPELCLTPSLEQLAGKRVLLIGEQGIGDQLMFASMLADLATTASSVTCVLEPRLMALLAGSFPGLTFIHPSGAAIDGDAIDVVLAMGSLGCAFRPAPASFPGTAFISASAAARGRWASAFGPRQGRLRIGLSWRGGVPSSGQRARSIPLHEFIPILQIPGCEFTSLQYGDVKDELADLSGRSGIDIRSFPPESFHDFDAFAGLIEALDLVVSVQNSTVHLAGALGKTCWALVPHNAEWRYLREGEHMPWYRSVRLFRQSQPSAWAPVIDRIAQDLNALRAGGTDRLTL